MITDEKNPVDVDKLLVVTYTEAAAAEMKERIAAAIEKKLEESPGNLNLEQQASLIHSAMITTVHKFCLSVIPCDRNRSVIPCGRRRGATSA